MSLYCGPWAAAFVCGMDEDETLRVFREVLRRRVIRGVRIDDLRHVFARLGCRPTLLENPRRWQFAGDSGNGPSADDIPTEDRATLLTVARERFVPNATYVVLLRSRRARRGHFVTVRAGRVYDIFKGAEGAPLSAKHYGRRLVHSYFRVEVPR